MGRFSNLVLAMASTVLLARVMDPIDYSRFTLVRTGLTMFGTVAAFGLGTVALKRLGSSRRLGGLAKALAPVVRLSWQAAVITGFVSGLLFWCWAPSVLKADVTWMLTWTFALGVVAIGTGEVWTQAARGLGKVAFSNLSGGLRGGALQNAPFLAAALAWYATSASLPWQGSVVLYCVIAVFSMTVARHVVRDQLSASVELSVTSPEEDVLHLAWPLALVALLSFTSTQADQLLAAGLEDGLATANYIAARRVIFLLSIPLSVLNVWLSGFMGSLLAEHDERRLERFMRLGATAAGVPCLLLTLMCTIFPSFALRVVLGPEYSGENFANAATYLRILSLGQAVLVLTGGCGLLLSMGTHQRVMLWVSLLTSAAILGGGPLCVIYAGGIGLSWLTSLAIAGSNLVTWWIAWRRTSINTAASVRMIRLLPQLIPRNHRSFS